MPNDLNWAGNCRGQITDYSLWVAESGAMAVNITARIDECWNNTDWQDYREREYAAAGSIWLVKKDGTLNQSQAEALMKYAGWDGNLQSIYDHAWEPKSCSFTTSEETYKGVARCRISWINAYDTIPGQGGNVTPEKLREFQNRYGSPLRAIARNLARNAAPPPAKAPTPSGPTGARRPTKNTPVYPDPNLMPPEDPSVPFESGPTEPPVDPQAEANEKFDEAVEPTAEQAEGVWRAELLKAKPSATEYERIRNGMAADPFLTEASQRRVQLLMDHRLKT